MMRAFRATYTRPGHALVHTCVVIAASFWKARAALEEKFGIVNVSDIICFGETDTTLIIPFQEPAR